MNITLGTQFANSNKILKLMKSAKSLLTAVAILGMTLSGTYAFAATSLRDSLEPVPVENGFSMPGYYLWCPTVIKVGDTYHMFASRWPAQYGMGGWTSYSECVRATSKNLIGPYKFEEVVMQKRPDHWDNSRVHNVKIVKIADTFVLYYINTANQTGYAWSKSITGPWTRCEAVAMKGSNPAILVRPDNSVYVMNRWSVTDPETKKKFNRAIGFTAKTFDSPYVPLKATGDKNLLPNDAELEDPCIWWANKQINVLVNDWGGKATGTGKAGAQYFSKDGVKYALLSKEPVFTKQIRYADGKTENVARRERPFVYVNEKEEVLALFTAVLPEKGKGDARIIAQPSKPYTPR